MRTRPPQHVPLHGDDEVSPFTGRTVVVTGAGGFIGGHLAERLVREGARVRGFVRYNSRNDRGTLDWLDPDVAREIEVVHGDLRDVESVAAAMRGASVVFHLAAQIAIPYSYVNPRDYFETNVIGTLNVAQVARDAGTERIVHTSTSEVYGTAQTIPIAEDHPLEAQSPYAASKVGADKLMDSFHRSFDLPVTILRPFNTYGPRQSSRAIVPTIISQALSRDTLSLGSLEPRRDLTFVSDTVAGFLAAGSSSAVVGRTIQLGTGTEVSVDEIVAMIATALGRELRVQQDPHRVRPPKSEVGRLVSNPALAEELLGWAPEIGLAEGLRRTIQAIRESEAPFRIDEYVI
jgi:dTDP-glucose 4,6-dehydratase